MDKDGTGPSSWFIKERRRKKTGKERKVENESFSADIHDAFCSFMLRCSSLFHLSKSLRNKNEAKLLRYSYSFLLSFIQPRDLHSHTSDEMWRRHRLRCSVSYNATLTQNNNNLRSGLAERELILKENTIIKAFRIIPLHRSTGDHFNRDESDTFRPLGSNATEGSWSIFITISSCKHLKYCSVYKVNGTLFRFIRKRQMLTAKLGL